MRLELIKIDYIKYTRATLILLIITILVFNLRNIHRIIKEVNFYQYKPLIEVFYWVEDGNFRVQKSMNDLIIRYSYCINSNDPCLLKKQKVYKKYGKIIFNNRIND